MSAGLLVIWVVIGVVCYREAGRFAARSGKTPWGWPAAVWGVVGFMLGLIGALIMFIAEKTTKAQPVGGQVVWSTGDQRFGTGGQYAPGAPAVSPPQWNPGLAPAAPPPQPAGQWAPPPPPAPGPPLGENFIPRAKK